MNAISKSNNSIAMKGDSSYTFSDRVVRFFDSLQTPKDLPLDVEVVYPYRHTDVRQAMENFYYTYFNDTNQRLFVLGINPGRFGSGMTGVPFTDPVALETHCGITNPFDKKRELSSEFVYRFIEAYGGPKKFYADFFPSAISPVGFIHNSKNYNYYDDSVFCKALRPFIVETLQEQISFGAKPTVILFGTGKNKKFFTELNSTYHFFDTVLALEHPRYIMQYKRKLVDVYVKKYLDVFSKALKIATR